MRAQTEHAATLIKPGRPTDEPDATHQALVACEAVRLAAIEGRLDREPARAVVEQYLELADPADLCVHTVRSSFSMSKMIAAGL